MAKESFGSRLQRLRGDMTRAALAKRAGVSVSLIGHYETGEVESPMPATAKKLARALGVTPMELLYGEKPKPAPEVPDAVVVVGAD